MKSGIQPSPRRAARRRADGEEPPIQTGTGGPRVEVDVSDERMQKKIRNAQTDKIPYMLVVGDKERDAGAVAVRLRNGTDLGAMPIAAFLERLEREIRGRKDLD